MANPASVAGPRHVSVPVMGLLRNPLFGYENTTEPEQPMPGVNWLQPRPRLRRSHAPIALPQGNVTYPQVQTKSVVFVGGGDYLAKYEVRDSDHIRTAIQGAGH